MTSVQWVYTWVSIRLLFGSTRGSAAEVVVHYVVFASVENN